MKSGYDKFFKTAQKVADTERGPRATLKKSPKINFTGDLRIESKPTAPRVGRKVQTEDSKRLAHQLRESMQPRMQKRRKKSIPWKLVGFSLAGLLITFLGLYKSDDVEKLAKNIEFSLIGVAIAEDVAPKASDSGKATGKENGKDSAKRLTKEAGLESGKESGKESGREATALAKKDYSEEEINHFGKLNERKRELDAREEELNRMEQELAVQKIDLEKRLVELESTRKNISSVLDEKVQGDDKKVENLVQMYSNMKPQQAAKAFEDMDENLAIEILGRMKKKNAAEIMNLVKSEKVKTLSEKYAGYKRN